MADKKYTLSVDLKATSARQVRQDIKNVADEVREVGGNAKAAGRALDNSLGKSLEAVQHGMRETTDEARRTGREVSRSARDAARTTEQSARRASSAVSSSMASARSKASVAIGAIGRTARTVFKGVGTVAMGAASRIGGAFKSVLLLPLTAASKAFGLLKGVAVGAAVAIASAWGSVRATLAALGPASDMQQYQIQMEVLLKDADKARKRLDELKKYAKTTNYSPQQVIQAANLMQSFGIYTFKRLQILGDVANAFGRDISEVVTSVNYLASGRSGEALESLSRFGVTRQRLSEAGMQFAKNGSLVTESKKALDILFRYMEKQFGGMTSRQAQTWKGALTIAGGQMWDSMARGFEKALKPMTDFVNGRVTPAIEALGNRLEGINWERALAAPLAKLGGIVEILRRAGDPKTSSQGISELKTLGAKIRAVFTEFIGNLTGFASHFVSNGGFQALGGLLFNSIAAGAKFFVALLRSAWDGLSDKFRSDILSVMPGSAGTYERRKRSNMTAATFAQMFPQQADAIAADKTLSHIRDPRSGQWVARDAGTAQELQLGAMRKHIDSLSAADRAKWDAAYASRMGWSGAQAPDSSVYYEGLLDDVAGSMGSVLKAMGGYKPTHKATDDLADYLDRMDAMGTYRRNAEAPAWHNDLQLGTPRQQPQRTLQRAAMPVVKAMPSVSAASPRARRRPVRVPSIPIAAPVEREVERRKRRTRRNNGLGTGMGVLGGRRDGVLGDRRGRRREEVEQEIATRSTRRGRGGESAKSVEKAIERGFQKGFQGLQAALGKKIYVVR